MNRILFHLLGRSFSAVSVLLMLYLQSCGGPNIRTDVALIYLTSTPENALVLIDDIPIGHVDNLQEQVTVPAGSHRLEIRAPEYLSYKADLSLEGGEVYGLIIELWPTLDELDD